MESRGKRRFEIEQDDPERSYGLEHEMEASSSRGKQRRISKLEIFLSHSGIEKNFVEQLYHDLKRANYHPFFDQDSDSLPKAEKFASKIFEAAEQCRLGVVVVSEGYLTSKWPMLELNKFVESKKTNNPDLKLFPLYYKLSPSDLNESEVETKWKPRWRQLVERGEVNEESVELWSQAVKELRANNGLEFAKFANSKYKYRCAVVDEMKRLLPPILEWDIGYIQGYERLCKVTSSMFNERVVTKDNIVHYYLGLYGTGGVGKTTLCKAMCSFLQAEFRGRVCHVELKGDQPKARCKRLKVVCQQLAGLKGSIQNEEQGWMWLENKLRDQPPVFLAIDNVGDSSDSREEAQKYLKRLPSGSKVIVTARSQEIVKSVVLCEEKYCKAMPRLGWQEAAMLFLSKAAPNRQSVSSLNVEEREVVERCLNECQFTDNGYPSKQYHPLVLKALGTYFYDVDSGMNVKRWEESLENKNKLQQCREGKQVNEMLGLNYHSLRDQVKLVFLDSALYYSTRQRWEVHDWWWYRRKMKNFERWILWISEVHGVKPSEARIMMKQLQRLSLLEDSNSEVLVHDLYKEFARVLVETKKNKEWEWWMSDVSNVAQLQRFVMKNDCSLIGHRSNEWQQWRNLVFLELNGGDGIGHELDLGGLSSLRVLTVVDCDGMKRIVCSCQSSHDGQMCRYENGGCLSNLLSVRVELSALQDLPFLRHCSNLQFLDISAEYDDELSPTYPTIGIDSDSHDPIDLRYLKALCTLRVSGCCALLGYGSVDLFIRWLVNALQLKNLTNFEYCSNEDTSDVGSYTIDLNQVDQLSTNLCLLSLGLPRQIEEVKGLHLFSELTTLVLHNSQGLRRLPNLERVSKLKWICVERCCKLEIPAHPCLGREVQEIHNSPFASTCLYPHCLCLGPYCGAYHCPDCTLRGYNNPTIYTLSELPSDYF